jgi:hypothetical protein
LEPFALRSNLDRLEPSRCIRKALFQAAILAGKMNQRIAVRHPRA